MNDNVTPFPHPNFNDIPAMLRGMADRIEAGDVTAEQAILLLPQDDELPRVFCYGHMGSNAENLGILDMAKTTVLYAILEDA